MGVLHVLTDKARAAKSVISRRCSILTRRPESVIKPPASEIDIGSGVILCTTATAFSTATISTIATAVETTSMDLDPTITCGVLVQSRESVVKEDDDIAEIMSISTTATIVETATMDYNLKLESCGESAYTCEKSMSSASMSSASTTTTTATTAVNLCEIQCTTEKSISTSTISTISTAVETTTMDLDLESLSSSSTTTTATTTPISLHETLDTTAKATTAIALAPPPTAADVVLSLCTHISSYLELHALHATIVGRQQALEQDWDVYTEELKLLRERTREVEGREKEVARVEAEQRACWRIIGEKMIALRSDENAKRTRYHCATAPTDRV
ncbi:hypothetical protein EDC01DRAFT_761424 [Geopyxis carbonaria]|nr:hypothetical protein EDC01DRAFT_761424 [Geopyxis carbonaria]